MPGPEGGANNTTYMNWALDIGGVPRNLSGPITMSMLPHEIAKVRI